MNHPEERKNRGIRADRDEIARILRAMGIGKSWGKLEEHIEYLSSKGRFRGMGTPSATSFKRAVAGNRMDMTTLLGIAKFFDVHPDSIIHPDELTEERSITQCRSDFFNWEKQFEIPFELSFRVIAIDLSHGMDSVKEGLFKSKATRMDIKMLIYSPKSKDAINSSLSDPTLEDWVGTVGAHVEHLRKQIEVHSGRRQIVVSAKQYDDEPSIHGVGVTGWATANPGVCKSRYYVTYCTRHTSEKST